MSSEDKIIKKIESGEVAQTRKSVQKCVQKTDQIFECLGDRCFECFESKKELQVHLKKNRKHLIASDELTEKLRDFKKEYGEDQTQYSAAKQKQHQKILFHLALLNEFGWKKYNKQ